MTLAIDTNLNRGCILYDGECAFCARWIEYWRHTLARNGFSVSPLQAEGMQAKLNLATAELLYDLQLLTPEGAVVSGADAYLYVMRRIWWAWPLFTLFSLPGLNFIFHRGYRTVANNRYCIAGKCRVPQRNRVIPWALLILLTAAAFGLTLEVAAWIRMWALVFALFAGFKWLTWWQARKRFPNAGYAAAYVFLWPGMDPQPFCQPAERVSVPRSEWCLAAAKIMFGIALIWMVVPALPKDLPLVKGWVGMAGLLFLLHFGALQLLAICWHTMGVNVRPIMRAPALATGVSDFWGERWNTAFRDLAHSQIFAPLQRRAGIRTATFAVFAVSGLIHDWVISVPAEAGFGLPTLYFLIQALAVLAERSRIAKHLGLQHGWRGRTFTWFVVLAPAPLLFHAHFAREVMLPFLRTIGAH